MRTLKDSHVVITGGTGALGSAVAKALVEAGAHCHVPAIETSVPADRFPKDGSRSPRTSICRTKPRSTASTPSCRRCMPW